MDNRVKAIVLLFSLFVASDFVLGYIMERSIPAGRHQRRWRSVQYGLLFYFSIGGL